ncbi:thiopurine S-methyltransferase [Legionella septentrionalis]|uniref:Thiopurine S-methyltransferase n=1 Tax=Legionella septentrionalis TaxID=2498109 RepID=A0A433JIH1_9GAMM|nr:thiopurine S-methyltransferase [Legionella septentrionalis]RUQ85082.1 thiopurine S-methyltransferase [Legionella septentrionalis]RUR14873.1 thiopurine S-methyltransferase [Legionella septentrionalis]
MQQDYWKQKWESGEIGFNQKQPNPLLVRYLENLQLKKGARIFVPLCGKSIDMLWLREQGYHVVGVELSELACRDFFQENLLPVQTHKTANFIQFRGDKLTLYAGNYFELTADLIGDVDAVYDRAALIALPPTLRIQYVNYFSSLLKFGTNIFLISFTYDPEKMEGPPFSVDANEIQKLYGSLFHIRQLYNAPAEKISAHVRAKGVTQASEQVYQLIFTGFRK